ncbi:MAG: hypothetical protein ACOCQD_00485 [archaeon]
MDKKKEFPVIVSVRKFIERYNSNSPLKELNCKVEVSLKNATLKFVDKNENPLFQVDLIESSDQMIFREITKEFPYLVDKLVINEVYPWDDEIECKKIDSFINKYFTENNEE